jgi:hypothetical protein
MSKPDRRSSIKVDVDGGDYTGGIDIAVSTRTAAFVMQYALQLHNAEIEKEQNGKDREVQMRQEFEVLSPRPKANPTEPVRGKK